MNKIIGILDYGMSNINSVFNAVFYLGYESKIVSNVEEIEKCSHLIIPGVGSYAKAMFNIKERRLHVAINHYVSLGKPILGICLGMQIFSDSGEEGGMSSGLGLIPGNVQYLDVNNLPIPHVGWNSLEFYFDHPICSNIKKHVDFYFIHSYFFHANDKNSILASAEYGKKIPAIIAKNNIVGVQFHPEKSQDNGLLLIENFCEWDGKC